MSLVLAGVLVAAVGWVVLSRTGKVSPGKLAEVRAAAEHTARAIGTSSDKLVGTVRGRFDRRAKDVVFKAWVTSVVDLVPGADEASAAFRTWLVALSARDLRAFRDQIAAFCATLTIDERWLRDGKPGDWPDLRHTLDESLGLFALAYARGASKRPELARVQVFHRWLVAPDRGRNRAFGAQLYKALVTRGLVTPPPDLLLASERTRRAYAIQAIREAAADQAQAFDAILAEVVTPAAPAATLVDAAGEVVTPAAPAATLVDAVSEVPASA